MSTPARKSRLAASMQKKAQIPDEPEATEDTAVTPATEPVSTTLTLAPDPAPEDESAPEAPATAAADQEPATASDPEPDQDEQTPAPGEPDEQATTAVAAQRAQVLAGTGQISLGSDLAHLHKVMANGRDQRRYVEDLPRRSDKGTYLRLPIHLQDTLAEYCDRNVAPMADFIAAVLDAYFRDIEILPPLGEGHRPNEKMLDKIRKQSRTYDY